MNLLPRRNRAESSAPDTDAGSAVQTGDDGQPRKGRPTPKRRDAARRPAGPLPPAPRTMREARSWQKQRARSGRTPVTSSRLTGRAYREAVKAGDPSALPRRDQGPARLLARNYVDSRRMISNYLFALMIFVLAGSLVPALAGLSLVSFALLIVIVAETVFTGRRIRALVIERLGSTKESSTSLGMYAMSRATMPRRWRIPAPQVNVGEAI